MEKADERFLEFYEEEKLDGCDARGLRADAATRWTSVCVLLESAAAWHEVLNEVLIRIKSYEYLIEPDDVERLRIIAKQYRVSPSMID